MTLPGAPPPLPTRASGKGTPPRAWAVPSGVFGLHYAAACCRFFQLGAFEWSGLGDR